VSSGGGFLVVGGDSQVGAELFRVLERRELPAFSTTRRSETAGGRRIFLDFESPTVPQLPREVDYAFLVAAATPYELCERDPLARRTNVELIPRLAATLLERGIFVTFISSNAVFGGERPWPAETDPHAPGIAYARQKSEGEAAIRSAARQLGAEERMAIVRLTKVVDPATSPLPSWLSAWERAEPVEPFADFIFAPISTRFAGDALATIGESRVTGQLHVSGAANVSYLDLANALADALGVDARLVSPTTADSRGVHIAFKPTYSGLGMTRTTELTGIAPQQLTGLVEDLVTSIEVRSPA
jgi:dTDP-4-dehydrorhamnose reductase